MLNILLVFGLVFGFCKGFEFMPKAKGTQVASISNFIGICPGKEKIVKGYYRNFKVYPREAGGLRADYEMVFKENFPPNLSSLWTIEKCSSKEAPDTCVPFSSVKTRQYCRMFVKSKGINPGWNSFVDCIDPPLQCPFKKGVYVGKNCTYDVSSFSLFPTEGFFWKFRIEVFNPRNNALLMCYMAEGGVVVKRVN